MSFNGVLSVALQSFAEEFVLLSTACQASVDMISGECQTDNVEEVRNTASCQASIDMISVECLTAWMSTVDAGSQTDTVEEVSQLSPHSLCQNEEKLKFCTGNGFLLLQ